MTGFEETFQKFGTQMGRYVDELGQSGPKVVERQAGLLAQTLATITPPIDPTKSRDNIRKQVVGKFSLIGQDIPGDFARTNSKSGKGEVIWYRWTPEVLYGTARSADKRSASVEELTKLYYSTTKTGKIRGQRGRQRVLISQKILTTAGKVKQIAATISGHVGRLRAGWLPSWRKAKSPGRLPAFVLKHEQGAKGYFIDQLAAKGLPSFTLANYAQGATEKNCGYALKKAMAIRAEAMRKDIALRLRGIKEAGAP